MTLEVLGLPSVGNKSSFCVLSVLYKQSLNKLHNTNFLHLRHKAGVNAFKVWGCGFGSESMVVEIFGGAPYGWQIALLYPIDDDDL